MRIRDPLPGHLSEQILDVFPSPVFLLDDRLRILGYNHAAELFVGTDEATQLEQFCGNVLRCLNESESAEPCGQGRECGKCVIRASVDVCWEAKRTHRKRFAFRRADDEGAEEVLHLRITTSPLEVEGRKMAVVVLEDVSDITRLQQILPICAGCKKIRDEEDAWKDVVEYVTEHTDVLFSHGYCSECADKVMAQLEDEDE